MEEAGKDAVRADTPPSPPTCGSPSSPTSTGNDSNSLIPAAFLLPQVQELRQLTDLNQPPDSWLHGDFGLEWLGYGPSLAPSSIIPLPPVPSKDLVVPGATDITESSSSTSEEPPPMSRASHKDLMHSKSPSLFIAEAFPDAIGYADLISTSDVIKKLLKSPFCNRSLSMIVHVINNTVLVDDLNLRQFQMYQTYLDSVNAVQETFSNAMREVLQMKNSSGGNQLALQPLKKDSQISRDRKLYSKFIAHSIFGPSIHFPLQLPDEHLATMERKLSLPGLDFTDKSSLALAKPSQLLDSSASESSSTSIHHCESDAGGALKLADDKTSEDDKPVGNSAFLFLSSELSPSEVTSDVVEEAETAMSQVATEVATNLPEVTYSLPSVEQETPATDRVVVAGGAQNVMVERSDLVEKKPPMVSSCVGARHGQFLSSASVHPMGRQAPFSKLSNWRFNKLQMVLGSNLPIFGCGKYPAVSLRLRESSQDVDVLTGIDYWLDNLICSVPELVMCWHVSGVVQRYSMVKTEDIPKHSEFDPKVISNIASNIMGILHNDNMQEGHTYWLHRARGDTSITLYDLTALCFRKPDTKSSDNPYAIPVAMLLYRTARHWLVQSKSNYRLQDVASLLTNCIPLLKNSPQSVEVLISSQIVLSSLFISHQVVERLETSPLVFFERAAGSMRDRGQGSMSAHDLPVQERMMQGISDDDDDETSQGRSEEEEDDGEASGQTRAEASEKESNSNYPNTTIQQVEVDVLCEHPQPRSAKRERMFPFPTTLIERAQKAIAHIEEALITLGETVQEYAKCLEEFLEEGRQCSSTISSDKVLDGTPSSPTTEGKSVAMKKRSYESRSAETVLSLDEQGFVAEGACACGIVWHTHAVALLSDRAALVLHVLASCTYGENRFGRALRYIDTAIACYDLTSLLVSRLQHYGCVKCKPPSQADHIAALLLKAECFSQLQRGSSLPGAASADHTDRKADKERHSFKYHAKEYKICADVTGVALMEWLQSFKGFVLRASPPVLQNTPGWLELQYQMMCNAALSVAQYDGHHGKSLLSPELYNTMVTHAAFATHTVGLVKLNKLRASLSQGTSSSPHQMLELVKRHFEKAIGYFKEAETTGIVASNITCAFGNLANCAHLALVVSHHELLLSPHHWSCDKVEAGCIADLLGQQCGYWHRAATTVRQFEKECPSKWDAEMSFRVAISSLALAAFHHCENNNVKTLKEAEALSDCSKALGRITKINILPVALRTRIKYCRAMSHYLYASSATSAYMEASRARSKEGLSRTMQTVESHWQKAEAAVNEVKEAVLLQCMLTSAKIIFHSSPEVSGKAGPGRVHLKQLFSLFVGALRPLERYTDCLEGGSCRWRSWDLSLFVGLEQHQVLLSVFVYLLKPATCDHNFQEEPLHCFANRLGVDLQGFLQQLCVFARNQGRRAIKYADNYTKAKDSLNSLNDLPHRSACQKLIEVLKILNTYQPSWLLG